MDGTWPVSSSDNIPDQQKKKKNYLLLKANAEGNHEKPSVLCIILYNKWVGTPYFPLRGTAHKRISM